MRTDRATRRAAAWSAIDAVLAHLEEPLIVRAAAKAEQARLLQIGQVDDDARSKS